MEQKLEKLFSQVLVTWLQLKSLADMSTGEEERINFLYAALQFESCLKDAGFEIDMKDYQKELRDLAG